MKPLLLTVMLVCSCGFAQTRSGPKKAAPAGPAPSRWPIAHIRVEGNRYYAPEQILAAAHLKVGQMAGKAEFETARDRLVSTGAFESVGYKFTPDSEGSGYAAVIQVAEVQQVYPVDFEDLHTSSKDLLEALRAKEPLFSSGSLPATQPVLERYSRWIEQYLAGKGMEEKISGMVAPADPGDYRIVFHPSRNLPAVAQITFEGNNVVPQNVLREAVSGAGIGAPYTEDTFRHILNASVRPVYEARGRLRVSFPKIRTEPAKDVQGLHVFVTVNEGQSYQLGKVAIEGPTPLKPADLLKAGDFKTGDVANMARVSDGLERMRKALTRAGYMQAKVTSERHIDDDNKAVDVTLYVEAGPQFTMGKLSMVGLDLEGEAEMKRIWTLKFGQPFNPDYPDLFLKRVREQGMFDDLGETKADTHLDEQGHTADVTLTFKGMDASKKGPMHRRGPGL